MAEGAETSTGAAARPKTLGQRDIVLYTVSAILLLETLAAAASIGPGAVFWWLLMGVLFFLPFGLICAEMGCSYPEEGGIYAWIRDAYGRRWGARASWSYWVNTCVWLPSIYVMFASVFSQLFAPELGLWTQIALGIALAWLTVLVNAVTLDVGKWVPNVNALVKVVVFAALIAGALYYAASYGTANPLTADAMLSPEWRKSAEFVPAIIYGMLGFELVSASSEEMKNPARDVPRGVLWSGLIILSLYILATLAMLAAIPAAEIDLDAGLVDTLRRFFDGAGAGSALVVLLGSFALYVFFANGVTWALGCNRAAAEAAGAGELPALFARRGRSGTPLGAAMAMGAVSSLALLAFGFLASSSEELFWSLFSFSAVIFMLPYLGLMLAFLHLRRRDRDHHRPFSIPGGAAVAGLCAGLCLTVLALCILLFLFVPGDGVQWPVLLGALVVLGLGEGVIRSAERA